MATVGLLINERNPAALQAARRLADHLRRDGGTNGVRVLAREAVAQQVGLSGEDGVCCPAEEAEIADASDFAVVFGGDGTLLAAARLLAPRGTPILGIHLGHFGFITEAPPERLFTAVDDVLAGRCKVEERLMLRGVLQRANPHSPPEELLAMNDIVAASGAVRMVHIRADIGGQAFATYAADGVIVASPTGSTGYSLSAGGPLVHPAAPVLLVTPISPHTLSARALVLPDSEVVRLTVEGPTRDAVVCNVDGQLDIPMETGDSVTVSRSPYSVRLLSVGGPNFYDKIRSRWHFGERAFS
jgi:NAD+ kinase